MNRGSEGSRHHRLTLLLALALVLGNLLTSSTSVIADGNYAQKTDAEAGCTYGTRPLSEWQIPSASETSTVHQQRGAGIDPNDPCYLYLYWTSEVGPSFNYSAAFVRTNPEGVDTQLLCTSAMDPNCQPSSVPNGRFTSLAGFYKCQSESDRNCVANVTVTLADGSKVDATFDRHFPDTPMIPESNNPAIPYPKGGPPTLWKYTSQGVERHIYLSGITNREWTSRNGVWTGPHSLLFTFGIQPVILKTGIKNAVRPTLQSIPFTTVDGQSGSRVGMSTGNIMTAGIDCPGSVGVDTDACLVPTDFVAGERFRVTFQVTKDMTFFLNGRLDAPIAFTEELADGKRLVIEGAPATLFSVSGSVPKNVLTTKTVAAIKAARSDFERKLSFAPTDIPPMGTEYPDLLSEMLPYFGDRTTFNIKAWTLRSSDRLGNFSPACYERSRGEVLGIISTNATAFIGDPPTLDPITNTLGYKVAAPHYGVDGKTLNIGRYYMNMNSAFTQCILGVEKVPDEATIGISYGVGEQLVSTVSVKQDKDWLRLQADNFTYSAPEIKVSFPKAVPNKNSGTNAGTTNSGSNANSISDSVPKKSKSITCTKGKKSKVITSAKPKCPVGWKKA